jgi:hypothetical protein
MFRFFIEAIEWLNPIVFIFGSGIAVWAFLRSHKRGYLVVAFYCILFALSVFSLLAMPSINRAIHANRPPDISTQTQQKIDAAVKEAVDQVLMQEGHPVVAAKQTIRFPFGPMVLVFGLWLVSRREPHQPNN